MNGVIRVYTDGSYKNGMISYGFMLSGFGFDGTINVSTSRPGTALQNVEAELKAVLEALKYLKRNYGALNNYTLILCYDLELIKSILTNPRAQARNGYLRNYVEQFRILQQSLGCKILFEKVKGHYHEIHNRLDRAVRRRLNEVLASA